MSKYCSVVSLQTIDLYSCKMLPDRSCFQMTSVPFFRSPCRWCSEGGEWGYKGWEVKLPIRGTSVAWVAVSSAGILWIDTDLFWVRMRSIGIIDTSEKHYWGLFDSTIILVEDKPIFTGNSHKFVENICHVLCYPFHEQLHHLWSQSLHYTGWGSGPSSIVRCPVHRLGPRGEADKSEPTPWCVEGHEQWWLIVKDYMHR